MFFAMLNPIALILLASATQYGVEALLLLNTVKEPSPHSKVQCGPGIESQCRNSSSRHGSLQKGKAKWNSKALNDFLDSQEFQNTKDAHFQTSAEEKTTRPVFFTHLLKAGGSHVNVLFHKVFGHGERFHGDADSAVYARDTATHENDYFRIGITRSPCDYMLSVWAFQQECPDCHIGQFECAPSGQVLGAGSVQDFRKWVIEQGSLQSFRVWQTSVDEPTSCNNCQMACFNKQDISLRHTIRKYFKHHDISARYDCLLHTENLNDEFAACINKYISEQPRNTRFKLSQRLHSALHSAKGIVNKGPALADKHKYFDNKTRDLIWKREKDLAHWGGYTSCLAH